MDEQTYDDYGDFSEEPEVKCSKCNRPSEIIGQYKIKDRGFVNVELCRRHHEELIEELNNNQLPYQVIIESYIPQDVILN